MTAFCDFRAQHLTSSFIIIRYSVSVCNAFFVEPALFYLHFRYAMLYSSLVYITNEMEAEKNIIIGILRF